MGIFWGIVTVIILLFAAIMAVRYAMHASAQRDAGTLLELTLGEGALVAGALTAGLSSRAPAGLTLLCALGVALLMGAFLMHEQIMEPRHLSVLFCGMGANAAIGLAFAFSARIHWLTPILFVLILAGLIFLPRAIHTSVTHLPLPAVMWAVSAAFAIASTLALWYASALSGGGVFVTLIGLLAILAAELLHALTRFTDSIGSHRGAYLAVLAAGEFVLVAGIMLL